MIPLKIALVAPYADPEKGACSLRVRALCEYLGQNGHNVTIFAPARPNVAPLSPVVRYSSIRELMHRVKTTDFDLVWGTSPPMTHTFFAGVAAKTSGKKFVVDLRDPWTYEATKKKLYSEFSPKLWVYRGIEQMSYTIADRIFVVTRFIAKEITKSFLADPKKIILVPNGTITTTFRFDESLRKQTREKLGIASKEVLAIFVGAFIQWGVEDMLLALRPLLLQKKIKLLFVIPYSDKSDDPRLARETTAFSSLQQLVQEYKISDSVLFVNGSNVSSEGLSDYLSAADVGFVSVPDIMNYSIPVKAYDYAAAGLPIIARAPLGGALFDLFEENPVGTCTDTWDAFSAAVAIFAQQYSFDPVKRNVIRTIAQQRFERKLSNTLSEQIFAELCSNRKSP